jgi:hypothetical protein
MSEHKKKSKSKAKHDEPPSVKVLKDCLNSYEAYTEFIDDVTEIRSDDILDVVYERIGASSSWNHIFDTVIQERLVSFSTALDLMHFTYVMSRLYNNDDREYLSGVFNLDEAYAKIQSFFSREYRGIVRAAKCIADDNSSASGSM